MNTTISPVDRGKIVTQARTCNAPLQWRCSAIANAHLCDDSPLGRCDFRQLPCRATSSVTLHISKGSRFGLYLVARRLEASRKKPHICDRTAARWFHTVLCVDRNEVHDISGCAFFIRSHQELFSLFSACLPPVLRRHVIAACFAVSTEVLRACYQAKIRRRVGAAFWHRNAYLRIPSSVARFAFSIQPTMLNASFHSSKRTENSNGLRRHWRN